jgi:hypothetical protein
MLKGIVHTEDDLRANLRDFLEDGKSVKEWATEIGLYLPKSSKPTRTSVIPNLKTFNPDGDWFSLRKPFLDETSKINNLRLLENIGIFNADKIDYGRLEFKTLDLSLPDLISFLKSWKINETSPGWKHEEIIEFLERKPDSKEKPKVILLENEEERFGRRSRSWVPDTGFVNLFQGRDTARVPGKEFYEGDRKLGLGKFGHTTIILQVHKLTRKEFDDFDLYTLALHIGEGKIVKSYE